MIRCRREGKEGEGRAPEPARPNARTNSQDAKPRRGKSGRMSRLKFRFNVVNPALLNKSAKFSVAASSFSPRLPSCRQVSTQKNRGLQCRFCIFASLKKRCASWTARALPALAPAASGHYVDMLKNPTHLGRSQSSPALPPPPPRKKRLSMADRPRPPFQVSTLCLAAHTLAA